MTNFKSIIPYFNSIGSMSKGNPTRTSCFDRLSMTTHDNASRQPVRQLTDVFSRFPNHKKPPQLKKVFCILWITFFEFLY
jgi:hypothetical protein